MNYQDLETMIGEISEACGNVPYAYYQFPETGQQPPFICWMLDGIDDLYADDVNFQTIAVLSIEYYSDEKDFQNELSIEAYLTGHGYSYGKEETYIDSERMHETIYNMEVVIKCQTK